MRPPLFERIGGESAIMAAVDRFYEKVRADELTRPFFVELDMEAQTRKQVAFMAWAFGRPEPYTGRDLRSAHARLVQERGLDNVHFDRVLLHLQDTLYELGVDERLVGEVLGILEGTRGQVLNR
jgi:hemoglobin